MSETNATCKNVDIADSKSNRWATVRLPETVTAEQPVPDLGVSGVLKLPLWPANRANL